MRLAVVGVAVENIVVVVVVVAAAATATTTTISSSSRSIHISKQTAFLVATD